jgi:hypothetical protein
MKVKLISYYRNHQDICAKVTIVNIPNMVKLNQADFDFREDILANKIKRFQNSLNNTTQIKSGTDTYLIMQSKINNTIEVNDK